MVSPSHPPNARTSNAPPDAALFAATIERLRAEFEAHEEPAVRATLLHEIGVLEESSGDEAGAARDLLSAVNIEPSFREPLERLITVIERRKSYKNLGKLLDRLVKVAETPAERARALVQNAGFLANHQDDSEGALMLLERLVEEQPEQTTAWLAMELLAGVMDDSALRVRALGARAEQTTNPAWRALLLVDLAKLQLEADDAPKAIDSLQKAIDLKGASTFSALMSLEEAGRRSEQQEVVARALEAQAALILRAIDDESTAKAFGIPAFRRSAAHAADAWLRAAEAHRRRGDIAAATALLDQALERLPEESALRHARMHTAEAAGDTGTSAALAQKELDLGIQGRPAAALWMRIAEAAAANSDGAGSLEALEKALSEDPGCIPARALELDLLGGGHDPNRLVAALEATANEIEAEDAKGRFYLLAADAWARLVGDNQGAKAALSQAGMYGVPPPVLARTGRMLAALTGDSAWYDESTRRLLAAGAPDEQQASLWFELGRSRLLRGELDSAREAFRSLAESPGGAWLGHALAAYAVELARPSAEDGAPDDPSEDLSETGKTRGSTALRALAEAEDDPQAKAALEIVASLRAQRAGDHEAARAILTELNEESSADLVVASALAASLRAADRAKDAAKVLDTCAAGVDDPDVAAALSLEAGILKWQAGDRPGGIDSFDTASSKSSESASGLLSWALRAAEPNSVDARRKALDAAKETSRYPALLSIERYGLEIGENGGTDEAAAALDSIDENDEVFGLPKTLAQSLHAGHDDDGTLIFERLAASGGAAAAVARGAAHRALLESGAADPESIDASAERWAADDASLVAALEWLGAAMATNDVEREVSARRAVGHRLTGTAAVAMQASASLLATLSGDSQQPPLAGSEPLTQFTNLDLAPPGCDPRRRTASLSGAIEAEPDEENAVVLALRGWNELAAGRPGDAIVTFRAVVEAHPEEIIGWDGLRVAAVALEDRGAVAESCAALGDAVADDNRGAEFWEAAAFILVDELGDAERGEYALGRAVERDIGRFDAFDRLFRLVRERKDGPRLLELIDQRLEVAEDPEEIAKMFWERARVLREAGDRDGALAALENVAMLEPDHVGALALSGEIYLSAGQLPEAAENLGRLATLDEAPQKQRLMSGVAAADIYERKLDDLPKALEVLAVLHNARLSTSTVRERLARTAAKVEDWPKATTVLEELMLERDTSEGRIEAARLSMAIHRDRMNAPANAKHAVEKLLQEKPDDGEAIDLVLTDALGPADTERLSRQSRDAVVQSLVVDPLNPEQTNRLAEIAAKIQDAPLRQAALGCLIALGHGTSDVDLELRSLDQRVAATPQMAIDERAVPDLCDPADTGPVVELMRAVSTTFAETLGPNLEALGVTKKDRVKPTAGLQVRNEIAAWAGALGVGDFELYVGGRDPNGVFGVATEPASIVVGTSVAAPLNPEQRQLIARELFALRRGTTILRHRDSTDIAALVVALCKIGGVQLASPAYAMLGEFERLLTKGMARKVKKALPSLAQAVGQAGQDPVEWVRAATSTLDRMSAVAAGDVSYVLSSLGGTQRGELAQSNEGRDRAKRILSFVLSPTYLSVREQLGMGVR